MKPIIGISGNILQDPSGIFPGYKRAYVNEDYVKAVIAAGGVPLILPVHMDKQALAQQVSLLDGLILSGGYDIDPYFYGEQPSRRLGDIYPERDQFEMSLLESAEKKNIPILGICRGVQMLNVYHGGSLYQDLDEIDHPVYKHSQDQTPALRSHAVTIDKSSILYSILKTERTRVNSFHHQCIHQVAEGFAVAAQADDGVIECIENKQYPWEIGIQWHPEMLHAASLDMLDIFKALVQACGEDK